MTLQHATESANLRTTETPFPANIVFHLAAQFNDIFEKKTKNSIIRREATKLLETQLCCSMRSDIHATLIIAVTVAKAFQVCFNGLCKSRILRQLIALGRQDVHKNT